jgi:chromosome segregation ATPase
MPMSPTETERKIRQLDNDVPSIYEALSAIQGTQTRHTNRLRELGEQLDTVGAKVDGLETRFDGLDQKIETVLELLRDG